MSVHGVETLESCAFVWFFDVSRRRFRRVPVRSPLHLPVPTTAWTDYFDFQVDEDRLTFRVSLNVDGTSVLRSSYHAGPCHLCGRRRRRSPQTAEGRGHGSL